MKKAIHTYGDEVLREPAVPVREVDDNIRTLAKDMIETMRLERGVGLAAQQVGSTDAICVIEVPLEMDRSEDGVVLNPGVTMPLVLVNPKITDFSGEKEVADEGCLSFPDIYAPVSRSVEVTVQFLDLKGKPQELRLKKFVARVAQHEIDHLNGVLLVDRMSRIKRIALSGQLKRLKKETREALETG
ncbi:MAG TPA: peptide deformylase [Kiritimatiellia bacterium]|nr:peptide deformylase [Kiritimatiellia bacterium]